MTPPRLAARGITAPLSGGAPVLRDVGVALAPGERLVLRGPSGSGKSTLLRCLVLLEPAEGEIRLDGDVVGPERVLELRRRVAWVPQRPVAVAPTVEENLAAARTLGRARDGDRGVLDAAAQDALLERLGLGTLDRGRRFDRLSGGEQQRLALVRSLTPRPEVLLLDEPTASLDPENVSDLTAVIREWAEADPARALLWVSHDPAEVEGLATRVLSMGELLSTGELLR
jgi:putative ABC transport system ATP-binding protein